jgi:hypothetical protein
MEFLLFWALNIAGIPPIFSTSRLKICDLPCRLRPTTHITKSGRYRFFFFLKNFKASSFTENSKMLNQIKRTFGCIVYSD